jgi:hypothetical protein
MKSIDRSTNQFIILPLYMFNTAIISYIHGEIFFFQLIIVTIIIIINII